MFYSNNNFVIALNSEDKGIETSVLHLKFYVKNNKFALALVEDMLANLIIWSSWPSIANCVACDVARFFLYFIYLDLI